MPRGFIVLALALPLAAAEAEGPWLGKGVLPKRRATPLHSPKPNARGKYEAVATLNGADYQVEKEDGRYIYLRERGVQGWLLKEDAVPLEGAVAYFTARVREDPRDASAHAYRGCALRAAGELDGALKDLTEAVRLEPDAPAWRSLRGLARRDRGEHDEAVADFGEALRLDPKFQPAYVGRGESLAQKGEHDKAIRDFDEALRLNPADGLAYLHRGWSWYRKKGYDRAVRDYDAALRLSPGEDMTYANRGMARRRLKEYGKAAEDFDAALRLNRNNARAHNERAWQLATCPEAKYRGGEQAVASAKQACELSLWRHPSYIGTLAAAYAEAGRFGEAVKYEKMALGFSEYGKAHGGEAPRRLQLYEAGKPLREE
jgi:tetratricopeptide (TPR) repeat protein